MKKPAPPAYIWENAAWPDYAFNAAGLAPELAAAESAIAETLALFRKLPVDLESEAHAELLTENALSTSRIEGENLNPDALRESAFRHLAVATPGAKTKVAPKTDGILAALLDATREPDAPLTLDHLARWQRLILTGPARRDEPTPHARTALRTKKVFVVSRSGYDETIDYEAPPAERVAGELKKFLDWFNGPASRALPPLLRAGLAHLWFEALHPFADGNGRIGRALIDRTLAAAYGPDARALAVAPGILRERAAYYAALKAHNQADGLDATAWLRWFLRNLRTAAPANQMLLRHVQAKARFWLRHRATPMNAKQRKVINRMADAGPAGLLGGMTNRKYVALTGVSDVTAYRDLADLVASGVLLPIGNGRSRSYTLNLPAT